MVALMPLYDSRRPKLEPLLLNSNPIAGLFIVHLIVLYKVIRKFLLSFGSHSVITKPEIFVLRTIRSTKRFL